MIARLVDGLRALAALPAAALADDDGRRLIADCADAVRLELDCPQQDLTRAQRAALHRLGDVLADARAAAETVGGAVRDACEALGVARSRGRER